MAWPRRPVFLGRVVRKWSAGGCAHASFPCPRSGRSNPWSVMMANYSSHPFLSPCLASPRPSSVQTLLSLSTSCAFSRGVSELRVWLPIDTYIRANLELTASFPRTPPFFPLFFDLSVLCHFSSGIELARRSNKPTTRSHSFIPLLYPAYASFGHSLVFFFCRSFILQPGIVSSVCGSSSGCGTAVVGGRASSSIKCVVWISTLFNSSFISTLLFAVRPTLASQLLDYRYSSSLRIRIVDEF